MKRFILNSLLFAFVLGISFFLIVWVTDHGLRKSKKDDFKEWNEIFDGKIDADVLILGSSRARLQYNTYILDTTLHVNSYNLGLDGTSFDIQYLRFKSYINHNKTPKILIQNVDWDTMERNESIFLSYQLLPYLRDEYVRSYLLQHDLFNANDIYFPFLKYSGQFKPVGMAFADYFQPTPSSSPEEVKYKGFEAVDQEWNPFHLEKRRKMKTIYWKKDKKIETLFDQFLKECAEYNIKVILVLSPPYYELEGLVDNYKGLVSMYDSIAQVNNLLFLNYSDSPVSKDTLNFYNTTHLNRRGAERFTLELTQDLKHAF